MESVIKKLGKASVTVEKDYHSSEKEYNKLTVVEEQGAFKTYLSRKPVPIGVALTNREYWIPFSGIKESLIIDYEKFKKEINNNINSIVIAYLIAHPELIVNVQDKSINIPKLAEDVINWFDKLQSDIDNEVNIARFNEQSITEKLNNESNRAKEVELSIQKTLENITKTGEASSASNVTYVDNIEINSTNLQDVIDKIGKKILNGEKKLSEIEDCIHNEDNFEYVRVEVDTDDRILSSIDKDGKKQENLPTEFTDSLKVKGKEVLTEHQDISYLATKEEVENVNEKVEKNKTDVNQLIKIISIEENPEYVSVEVDSKDKILSAITNKCKKKEFLPIEYLDEITVHQIKDDISLIKAINNSEYLKLILDADERIVLGLRTDGNLESPTIKNILEQINEIKSQQSGDVQEIINIEKAARIAGDSNLQSNISKVSAKIDTAVQSQNAEIVEFKNSITEQIKEYKPIQIEGNITNAADEEDITSEEGLLKFKNRSGVGQDAYIILRKNLSLADQLVQENTIYEVKYNFDLQGQIIKVPYNCALVFNGGHIINGALLANYNTRIENIPYDLDIRGTIYNFAGQQITIKGDVINRVTKIYYPVEPKKNIPSLAWAFDKYGLIKDAAYARNVGIMEAVLLGNLKYNPETKKMQEDTCYLGNNMVDFLINNGLLYSIYMVKFHIATTDTLDNSLVFTEDVMKAYNEAIIETMSSLKNAHCSAVSVAICNERLLMSGIEMPANYLVQLASELRVLGYDVTTSAASIYEITQYTDSLKAAVTPSFNFYPPMSYANAGAKFSEEQIKYIIQYYKLDSKICGIWDINDIGITECGTMPRENTLRAPWIWDQSPKYNTGEVDAEGNPIIVDNIYYAGNINPKVLNVFWENMLGVVNYIKPKFICIWYVEFLRESAADLDKLYKLFLKF